MPVPEGAAQVPVLPGLQVTQMSPCSSSIVGVNRLSLRQNSWMLGLSPNTRVEVVAADCGSLPQLHEQGRRAGGQEIEQLDLELSKCLGKATAINVSTIRYFASSQVASSVFCDASSTEHNMNE